MLLKIANVEPHSIRLNRNISIKLRPYKNNLGTI